MSEEIIQTIRALNSDTTTRILVNNSLTDEVPISTGIRQGDSLSPLLFNMVMDRIIEEAKGAGHGYRTDKGAISIVCYADDALLISENEDDLQRLTHQFYLTSSRYNMEISIQKTKSLVVAKNPVRCKLIVNDQAIEQVMTFTYLGVEISSSQDRKTEVLQQSKKAARMAGCLRDLVWNNKYMKREGKVRIYKTCIRPILTYAAETRADTAKTKSIARTTEMRILRNTPATLSETEYVTQLSGICVACRMW